MAKVYIGVGHGGSDSGAVGNGFNEKDLNLSISLVCKKELERHGIDVRISRTNDNEKPLERRIVECNAFYPDLAMDIHNNAGKGDGAEVFYHYGGGTGKTLAQNILNEIVKIGQNSRGIKTKLNYNGTDYFGFIRQTTCPAVIVECAFVDNSNDIKIIDTAKEQNAMGVAIAKGVISTLGMAYIPEETIYYKPSVSEWQKAVIADGYTLKYGVDGIWGNECESVAMVALVMQRNTYLNKNLTKIVQKVVGVTVDGLCGPDTEKAIVAWQRKSGLSADGIVGINSWKKIMNV